MKDIDITKILKEAKFNFSRSGGKGGQNVNKVETKAEIVFNIPESLTIMGEAKMTLLRKLKNKVDKEGNTRIYAQTERSQLGNRKKAVEKFTSLIKNALKREPIRIKTKEPVSSKLERLDMKRKISEKKKARSQKNFIDD